MEKGTISQKPFRKKMLAVLLALLLAASLQLSPLFGAAKAYATEEGGFEVGALAADDDDLGFETAAMTADAQGNVMTQAAADANAADYAATASLPTSWDPREAGNANHAMLTPVRDQSPFGVCWTFGYGQALESATVRAGLSPSQSYSSANWISSIQLANAVYNDRTFWKPDATSSTNAQLYLAPMAGGTYSGTIAALSKWYGAVPESVAPWPFDGTEGNIVFYAYLVGLEEDGESVPGIQPGLAWKAGFDPEKAIKGNVISSIADLETVFRNAVWQKDGTYKTIWINKDFEPKSGKGVSQDSFEQKVTKGQPVLAAGQLFDSSLARAIIVDYVTGMNKVAADEGAKDMQELVQSLYVPDVTEPEIAADSVYHVQDAVVYPLNYTDAAKNSYSPKNVQTVKQAIKDKGSLQLGYSGSATQAGSAYFNIEHSAQYVDDVLAADHSVSIVGWEDGFPRANFNTAPSGDGAFICKNSWGTGFGDGGFFYLSYYDKSIADIESFDVEASDNYDNVAYLDDIGTVGAFERTGGSAWMANVFSAPSFNPVTIDAVGIQTQLPNQEYEIKVYTNIARGAAPTSGKLAASWSGKAAYAGYFTYEAPKGQVVKAAAGTNYAVVVKVTNAKGSGYSKVNLPTEGVIFDIPKGDQSGYNFQVNAGESYLSADGKTWKDVMKTADRVQTATIPIENGTATVAVENGNFNIKAYTNNADPDPVSFPDVPKNAWYAPYVSYVAGTGIMFGYSDSSNFGPDDSSTRGQVATVLYRLAGSPGVSGSTGFSDVGEGMFYSAPVKWAKQEGVVTGYTNTGLFMPDQQVSRQEMATMVARYASKQGIDIAVDDVDKALSKMTDAKSIAGWAKPFAAWCATAGIMTGKDMPGGTKLADPNAQLTRGEMAKMLTVLHRDVLR